jgi:hypothetical protein
VGAHPPIFEVIRLLFVCEDVDEEPPLWFQRLRDLGQEELIDFHVIDRDHPIKRLRLKVVRDHISSDHLQIR